MGLSDRQVAKAVDSTEDEVCTSLGKGHWYQTFRQDNLHLPQSSRLIPISSTTTYNAASHDATLDDHGIIIMGSGVSRIGSSIEFDWCAVTATLALKAMGWKTIMINYNPETHSTEFDTADKRYYEELSYERLMDIYELGCIIGVVGQPVASCHRTFLCGFKKSVEPRFWN